METLGGRASGPPPGLNERHWGWTWRMLAACLEEDPELFYPEDIRSEETRKAKAICRRCIVREECLAVALAAKDDNGIWGGLTPDERRTINNHRCLWCKAPLLMWRRDKKYCGPTCANRYASRERTQCRITNNRARLSRKCVWCGGDIPPDRRSDSVTCSRDCNTKLQNKRQWERKKANREAPTVAGAFSR